MTKSDLVQLIRRRESFLCVGLDTDIDKIPAFLLEYEDPVFEFNRRIIDATSPHCIAYKPNVAFYEAMGSKGWDALAKTLDYIPDTHFTIADAKRGDIGNTSHRYAQAFFETLDFDAVTVTPYMGYDSIAPFLQFDEKWVIILALTSNPGSADFQWLTDGHGMHLYEHVLKASSQWGSPDNTMFVVGATQATSLRKIRQLVPDHFLLVPGVGTQGGDLHTVYRSGATDDVSLLVNASRSIIYAGGQSSTFERDVASRARALNEEMKGLLGTSIQVD